MKSASAAVLLALAALAAGCGKKGDPLPPLVRVPAAPADLVAERRAAAAQLRFTVPASNTDGTRPANIQRVDVYALTAAATVSDDELLKRGTRIASLAVKAPRDPDDVIGPDEPVEDLEPLQGTGLDQGSAATVTEDLASVPAAGPGATEVPVRQYLAVGISTRGSRGLLSRRAAIPLVAAPPAPPAPALTYDASSLILTWGASDEAQGGAGAPVGYHVYETGGAAGAETRLTTVPTSERRFADTRIEWGKERCYAVRAARVYDNGLTAESAPTAAVCITPADKFPPAPPAGLTPVTSGTSVNLTWDSNADKDLAGYLVLRGVAPAGPLQPITPAPIQETSFRDTVPSGISYLYAVQAVDSAGNVSEASARVEAAAP